MFIVHIVTVSSYSARTRCSSSFREYTGVKKASNTRSVLGPLLFLLYTVDLAGLAKKFGVKLHAFAEDKLATRALRSQQCVVISERTGTLCHFDRLLDVSQPDETQRPKD